MAKSQNGTNSTTTTTGGNNSTTSTNSAPFATVTVGTGNGTNLVFDPPVLPYVPPNNTVRFEFHKLNHTLTESSFSAPCTKLSADSFDTGFTNFNPNDEAPFKTVDVAVSDLSPRFFYCRQVVKKPHCEAGMVFALNAGQDQFAEFQRAAEAGATPSPTPAPAASKRGIVRK